MPEKITEEWVLFWYQCLSENLDYSDYCSAQERGEIAACQKLESQFPLLPELHRDFGSLTGWPNGGIQGPAWKAWFEPRRHLFIQSVEEVKEGTELSSIEGSIMLRVPLQESSEATMALVREYVDHLYLAGVSSVAPRTKYQLHMRGNRIACGYQQVRQAVHTSTVSYAIDPLTYDYLPIRQVIVSFLRGELDHMGWSIGTKSRRLLTPTEN